MLIVTGATVTILKKEVFDRWSPSSKPTIKPVSVPLRTATGELSSFYGKISVNIKLGKKTFQHEVWLADVENDGILGVDFMKSNECDLLLSKGFLSIQGEEIPCYENEHDVPPTCCRIQVPMYVEVAPESEVIIPGKPMDNVGETFDDLQNGLFKIQVF